MTAVSEKKYIDTLDETVDKYNSTYRRRIKMKPVDVKSSTYTYFDVESNDKDPKFKISDQVKIYKYKNDFANSVTLRIGLEEFL